MYRVFLADDEKAILENLKQEINWESYGFTVIGSAPDGISAFGEIMKLRPELVVTDIRMPGMNGLELLKNVREALPHIQFIILSGFADFSYAQEAIQQGVIGYALKPYDEDGLGPILKKAGEVISGLRNILSLRLLPLLEEGRHEDLEEALPLFVQIGVTFDRGTSYYAVCVTGIETSAEKQNFPWTSTSIPIGPRKRLYFVERDQESLFLAEVQESKAQCLASIGFSNLFTNISGLRKAFKQAIMAARGYFLTGSHGIFHYKESSRHSLSSLRMEMEALVKRNDMVGLRKKLSERQRYFVEAHPNLGDLLLEYRCMEESFAMLKPSLSLLPIGDVEELTELFDHARALFVYLNDALSQHSLIEREDGLSGVHNITLRKAMAFIHEQFKTHISIQDLSENCGINPNYMSQLFKKELGMTFTQYVTDLRINHACRLMKTTGMSTTEIAEKCGYEDYFYFSRVFKKHTNQTPSQFRGQ